MSRGGEMSGSSRVGTRILALAAGVLALIAIGASRAGALDIDIFTGNQVKPNVLIVFDNSGSMGVQAYNTYPNTVYTGSYTPGTIYTRCKNKGSTSGGDVNVSVTPGKDLNKLNGVNASDVQRIQQHLGSNPITNPWQLIAADVNSNNTVTSLDANIIQLSLLNNPQALAQFVKSWRFVPTSHTMASPPWGFPEKITLSGVSGPQPNKDFYGIKVGDVAAVYANPANAGQALTLRVWDRSLVSGETLAVDVEADPVATMAALQLALRFDPTRLRLSDVEPLGGLPLSADNFGTHDLAEGSLRLVWAAAQDVSIKQTTTLFRLRFRVLESGGRLSDVLSLDEEALPAHTYTGAQAESGVVLQFRQNGTSGAAEANALGVQLMQNRPNPFLGQTAIAFVLPEACEARLRVLDARGRVVAERSGRYQAGRHEEPFEWEGAAGVLYYELVTPSGVLVRKMEKL